MEYSHTLNGNLKNIWEIKFVLPICFGKEKAIVNHWVG